MGLGRPDGHRATLSLSWEARRPQSYAPTAWRGPMAKVLYSHCLGRPNGHRATFLLYGEARRPQIVTLKLRAENFDLQKHNLVPKLFLTRLLTEQRFHCLGRPDGHRGTLPLLGGNNLWPSGLPIQ